MLCTQQYAGRTTQILVCWLKDTSDVSFPRGSARRFGHHCHKQLKLPVNSGGSDAQKRTTWTIHVSVPKKELLLIYCSPETIRRIAAEASEIGYLRTVYVAMNENA